MPVNQNVFFQLLDFIRVKKKWWLLPIVLILIIASIFIIVGQSSSISPFIYALF